MFLSDGFKEFQKICDSICPGAWFLGVNLTLLYFEEEHPSMIKDDSDSILTIKTKGQF